MTSDIEKDNAFDVADDSIFNKPIRPVAAPERKRDVDLENHLYDNIIQAGLSSQLDISSLSSLNNRAENRNQMYNIYDSMCEDGTIGAVVETYAEDATERNDYGDIVWVESPNKDVSQAVEYLLDTLNINKNVYKWCYSLCKYGDLYLRLYRRSEYEDEIFRTDEKEKLNEDVKIKAYSKNDKYVHYMEMVANPATMFELTKFGKTAGYVQAPVSSTVVRNDNTSFATLGFNYKFKKDDVTLYPATEFVHACLEDNTPRETETVNIFTNQEDYDNETNAHFYSVKKGQSLLSNVYKVWRELQLLESSVLLNRITKSSIVRLINVEVGDMPKENIAKTLMGIKQMVEQKASINVNNSMNEYTNPGPVENNVYVPTHEGVGAISTTQIGGDVDVKSLADLDYYMNKMYGQLRVPKQYFSQTDDSTGFNGGTSLSIISSRYAKMIKRIQNALIQAITDAINLMLIDMKLDAYVNEFTIHMLPPTTQEEIDRRDNLSGKVQLTSDIMTMLADVEDPTTKLKMLKSLLANVVDDNEIITLLQEYIEKTEQEDTEELDEDPMSEEDAAADFSSSGGLNADLGGEELPQEEESSEGSSEDAILPSPDDLGVDLSDSDVE